ncbi:MAG: hypothetical protein IJU52_06710 [Clostridia bacterium]|nr:hypothetical protein [Clostridia bacterium]
MKAQACGKNADPKTCFSCGAVLTSDEIAMYRKAVNRGAQQCQCLNCLSARFNVSRAFFEERIAFLKAHGCTLFE